VNKCILALQERDSEMLDRTAGAIRGRCGRVCGVVAMDMMSYEPGPYTERVMESVVVLRDQSE
jgi:Vinculin family